MKTLQHPYTPSLTRESGKSIVRRFFDWCKSQEENRLLWLGIIIVGHGCIITPVTVLFILFSGNSMFLWALAIAAMAMSLISNLAAAPTRITLPIFFFSLLIDLVVIISAISSGFNFAGL